MTKARRNILMIGPLPPPVHGSAMMTRFIKESPLIGSAVRMDWVNLSTSRSMTEIGKGGLRKLGRFASAWFRTLRLLLTHRYDAAYIAITCRGTGFLKDAPFALLCKLLRVPLILHQHNRGMSAYVDRPIYRRLLRMVYRNARVVLLSEHLYPDISAIVDHSQVEVCTNGIPDISPRSDIPAATSAAEPAEAPARLLFLSNLMPVKGVWHLLAALRTLHAEGYDFTCSFVGAETPDLDADGLRSVIDRYGLSGKVSYLGKRYGEEKEEVLRGSDIFVFPTLYDCFPLVLLEAMQHGMAVVAAEMGGIPDIITDGEEGRIVPALGGEEPTGEETRRLADALRPLVADSALRREMGRKARRRYEQCFTLPCFEKRMVEILTEE